MDFFLYYGVGGLVYSLLVSNLTKLLKERLGQEWSI